MVEFKARSLHSHLARPVICWCKAKVKADVPAR
jgi:hypothetical protein